MKIIIKKSLDVTPPLETYIEEKLMPLGKFVEVYEKEGEVTLRLEVSRTTEHHGKGKRCSWRRRTLNCRERSCAAKHRSSDIRKAIDEVRNMMHMEIQKYKTKHSRSTETEREK